MSPHCSELSSSPYLYLVLVACDSHSSWELASASERRVAVAAVKGFLQHFLERFFYFGFSFGKLGAAPERWASERGVKSCSKVMKFMLRRRM